MTHITPKFSIMQKVKDERGRIALVKSIHRLGNVYHYFITFVGTAGWVAYRESELTSA